MAGKGIVIDSAFSQELENNIMSFLDSAQEVTTALQTLNNRIGENFKGEASKSMMSYGEKLEKDFGGVLGDFIDKNLKNLKSLQDNFEKVDRESASSFEFSTTNATPHYNMPTGMPYGNKLEYIPDGIYKRKN